MPKLSLSPHGLYWTSDTHFFHKGIIRLSKRPFDSVEHMNASLIANWNARVGKLDTVIHVGDMLFGNSKKWNEVLDQLNGEIILVEGNHDRMNNPNSTTRARFKSIHSILELDVAGQFVHVCHYPMLSWRDRQRGSIHAHGHSHGGTAREIVCPVDGTVLVPPCRRLDVGVDCATRYGAPAYSPIKHSELLEYALGINEAHVDSMGE